MALRAGTFTQSHGQFNGALLGGSYLLMQLHLLTAEKEEDRRDCCFAKEYGLNPINVGNATENPRQRTSKHSRWVGY